MTPLKVTLENFLSHVHSEIDLSTCDLTLITGEVNNNSTLSNGAGKTSIFEAICWAITGQCRTDVIDDVVRYGSDTATVSFCFNMPDGQIYKIDRKRVINKSSDVRLYIKDGDKWKNISGRIVKGTNKKILDLVRFDYETFVNSIYFKQNSLFDFSDKTPADKITLLKKLLRLDIYDRAKRIVKSSIDSLSVEVQALEMHLNKIQVSDDQIKQLEKKEIELLSEKSQHFFSIQEIEKTLSSLNKEAESFSIDKTQLPLLESKYIEAKNSYSKYDLNLRSLETKMSSFTVDKVKETYQSRMLDIESISLTLGKYDETKTKSDKDFLLNQLGEIKGLLNSLNESLEQSLKLQDECFVCGSPISAPIREGILSHKHAEISSCQNKQKEVNVLLAEQNKLLFEIEDNKKKFLSLSRDTEVLKNSLLEFKSWKDQKQNVQELLKQSRSILSQAEKEYADHKTTLERLDELTTLQNKIITYNNMKSATDAQAQDCVFNLGKCSQSLKTFRDNQILYNSGLEDLNKKKNDLVIWKHTHELFSKSPVFIINSAIEEIQYEANAILSDIQAHGLFVKLENNSFEIKVINNNKEINFASLSGGEKTKVSIAIRLALSTILARRSGGQIKFLLLDEVSSALDEMSIESLIFILNQLKKKFKIFLISHEDRMKAYFNSFFIVKKTENGSTCNV